MQTIYCLNCQVAQEQEAVAETERTRILMLLDDLITHYARSSHPGLTGQSRASVLKALRLLKGRIQTK
jgi:hypothetical protein